MNELLKYLNSLNRAEQVDYATRCKTTAGYLRKACSTGEMIREIVCSRLEKESGGVVKRQSLRPDWRVIWPELATSLSAEELADLDARDIQAAPVVTPEDAFFKLASGLELVDRRTGPDNRRVAPQPFEGLDRRVALEPRRAIDRAKADIANAV